MSLKNNDDIKKFVEGCTFLGAGGGGNPQEGFKLLSKTMNEKGEITWENVKDINDDSIAICTFLMGSTAPLSEEKLDKKENLGLKEFKYENNLSNAVLEWEEYTGKKVDIIVPLEIGGSNMPVPMSVAKKLNKRIVDGDYSGRAIPEIFQISLMMGDISLCPATSVDKYGNICIIKDAINFKVAERIGKYLSEVAFGSTGIAGFPISGKNLKKYLIKGSMTKAFEIGDTIYNSKKNNSSLEKGLEKFGCKLIFKGKVINKEWRDEEGYYSGYYYIEGYDNFSEKKMKIYFKNENHIAWLGNEPIVTSPDLICCIDLKEKQPLVNEKIKKGSELEVYAMSCNEILKNKEVLKWTNPKYFGFDIDYKPFEK